MEVNDYQNKAMATCLPTSNNFPYMMLNLIGEVGEVAQKALVADMPWELKDMLHQMVTLSDECSAWAKEIRKTEGHPLQSYDLKSKITKEQQLLMMKEAGDVAWQLAGLCKVMGWELENVCNVNLYKLASRKERNVIDGNGDER